MNRTQIQDGGAMTNTEQHGRVTVPRWFAAAVVALLVLIAILLVVLVTRPGTSAAPDPAARSSASNPADYSGNGTAQTVTVVIARGATGYDIGRALETAGVVKSAKAYTDAANLDERSTGIRSGSYVLHRQMSATAALNAILTQAPGPLP
jgi:cell division protein YceG involved in septum cleavage